MYVKRVRIVNYGPIDQLDIELPFEGDKPKPVVLVGENGSGKSIVLSHIVNGLSIAKDVAYPDNPEVESNRVYKLRSHSYIKSGRDFYCAKVDFEDGLFTGEIRLNRQKREHPDPHPDISAVGLADMWNEMSSESLDHFSYSFRERKTAVREILSKRCALFFPPNRFENPAWLTEMLLSAHAIYMDRSRIEGQTTRRLINHSPLRDNQNWLFDIIFDRALEFGYRPVTDDPDDPSRITRIHPEHSGIASDIFGVALQILREVMRDKYDAQFRIGGRLNRTLSVYAEPALLAPVFQLSTGETAVLNVFLSILRDYDLSDEQLTKADDVRGVVIVDEVDLHLHAIHQYEVLPTLIQMFPNVQFIVTTHSPLFVLGMNKIFGEQGFVIHRLPSGNQISPEEFGEFESAYQAFRETNKFSGDIRTAIEDAKKPVVFMEGKTDVAYVSKAAHLLGRGSLLEMIELLNGGGFGGLNNIWKTRTVLDGYAGLHRVILLYDCERKEDACEYGRFFRRSITKQESHPIDKGIENLFAKSTLENAQAHNPAFIDVVEEHTKTVHGTTITVPEKWGINEDEKTNLCNWLCENGAAEDFQHFRVIFDLIVELVSGEHADPTAGTEPAVVETSKSNNGASRPAGG